MSDQDQPDLTPEQRRRVDEVLAEAMAAPPGERDTLVVRRCSNDGRVLAEVLALLGRVAAGERDTVDSLEQPARIPSDVTTQSVTSTPAAAPPDRIGTYEILRVIGRGGMGTVYEARQDSPRRRVALKIINPGVVSHELLRRFEVEAQILGRLQHPGIAQIFEAGTFDQGAGAQPFFAMEFVDGVPLVQYARKHELGNRERLELLAKVCDAVQHAHQRGVIHRDLKPGNILVVDDHGDGAQGAPAPVRPHPAASPPPSPGGRGGADPDRARAGGSGAEQSKPPSLREGPGGGRIKEGAPHPKILDFGVARATDSDLQTSTLRTDIGQLIGTVPYMSPEQAAGDPDALDTRSDVYALGVIAYELLADRLPYDVQRKMIHEAVRIIREDDPTPLSSVNRTFRGDVEIIVGKALEKEKSRRYQSASDLASDIRRYLTDEPILARPPSMSYQLGKFARRNRALVSGIAAVFVVLVAGIIGTSLGLAYALAAKADAIEARNNERDQRTIAEDNELRARIEQAKAEQVAEFTTGMLSSVDPEIAGELDKKLMRMILDDASDRVDTDLSDQPEVEATIRQTIGNTYLAIGVYDESERHLERSRVLRQRVLGERHPETLASIGNLADLYWSQGRYDEAEPLYAEAIEAHRGVLGEEHRDTIAVMVGLANLYYSQARYDEAEPLYVRALETQRRVLGEEHPDTIVSVSNLAFLYQRQGRYDEAAPLSVWALDTRRRILGEEHPRTVRSMGDLANLYWSQGRYDEAELLYVRALETQRRVLGEEHPGTLASMNDLANLYHRQGRYDEAETLYVRVLEARGRILGEKHPGTLTSMNNLSVLYQSQGRYDEAETLVAGALETQRLVLGEAHSDTLRSAANLAMLYRSQGRYDEAEPLLSGTLETLRRVLGKKHPETLASMGNLANLYWSQGRHNEAEALYASALDIQRSVLGKEHPRTLAFMNGLAVQYASQGRYEEAEPLYAEALDTQRRVLGEDHPETVRTMNNLADLYKAQRRFEAARPLVQALVAHSLKSAQLEGARADVKNSCAWTLLTCEPADFRDAQTALALALAANDMTGHENLNYLHTLSLAYHMTGATEKGIENQKKAIALLPPGESDSRTIMEAALAELEASAP